MENPGDYGPPQISLLGLFLKFLRFGALAFGGPVAQIAMVRQAIVEEERWIDPARFNRLLAVMQILPGPEAHELCVHSGMIARGRAGGVAAGIGFMLPGFLLMLAAGWIYARWIAGNSALSPILLGVQIVVLAIILVSTLRIGRHMVGSWLLGAIALASLAATLAGVPFWIPLVAGGVIHALSGRTRWIAALLMLAGGAALSWSMIDLAGQPRPAHSASAVTSGALFLAGLKGGLLTFGGAYTAIPYVRDDTVGRGWIDDATFLDGVAIAGVLPAPLVIFATFTGYIAGGFPGSAAITLGMFLPAFAFSLIFFERLEAIVDHPTLHHLLNGVAAAVAGVILATVVDLGQATFPRLSDPLAALLLFAVALIMMGGVRKPWIIPAIIAAGAAGGWLIAP